MDITDTQRLDWLLKNCKVKFWSAYNGEYLPEDGIKITRQNIDSRLPLPKKLIRLDDGMEFVLNERTQLYRAHLGNPELDDDKHLHNEYSYERLMEDPRSIGAFKVADGTEDVESMKKAWVERLIRENE